MQLVCDIVQLSRTAFKQCLTEMKTKIVILHIMRQDLETKLNYSAIKLRPKK